MSEPTQTTPPFAPDPIAQEAFTPASAPRRILVYAPLAYWTPHFETDLEIAQRHLDIGDQVELALCDGELSSCQFNPTHDARCCLMCVSRNLQGPEQLSVKVPVIHPLSLLEQEDLARLSQVPSLFADAQELKRYRFGDFDAGLATLSSMIDFLRNPEVNTVAYREVVQRLLLGAVSSYLAFRRLLARTRYDRVYIFNGRWSIVRSMVRACEHSGTAYYTHERGAEVRKFSLYKDSLPHDMAGFIRQTRLVWERNKDHPDFGRVGASFFEDRRARVERTWYSFVKHQEVGRVPDDWNRGSRRILFCTSSEYEFAAIDEGMFGRIYPSQLAAAAGIAALLSDADPSAHLWIRVHPNDATPETVRKWTELCAKLDNVTLVEPAAKVDSYAMLDGADRVVGFGSTIGVEASYWGKPSICAEYSYYSGMDAQYEASTETELLELLTRPDLQPKPREHAIRIGFFLCTFGDSFKYFDTDTISDVEYRNTFRGRAIKPDIANLYQRLIGLLDQGDLPRAATISRLAVDFTPDNAVAHSVRLLSLLRLKLHVQAIAALEEAATKLPAAQLSLLFRNTAKAFLDLSMQLSTAARPEDFRAATLRIANVFACDPNYAPIGQRLQDLANRLGRPGATPPSGTVISPTHG